VLNSFLQAGRCITGSQASSAVGAQVAETISSSPSMYSASSAKFSPVL